MGDGFIQKLRQVFGLTIIEDTDLEIFCKKNYVQIPNIAYKNKRSVKSLSYSVFLNEIFTPEAYMIAQLKKGVLLKPEDRFQRWRNLGNVVAKRLTWTDDKNLDKSGDYYLYPSETLVMNKGDCEDHSFVMASALPEDLGVAYGFWNGGGHAFNVGVLNGDLYIIDTVGDEVNIKLLKTQTEYVIHFIITPKLTFQVRGGTQFGEIAGY
jgi:hypothetical protein